MSLDERVLELLLKNSRLEASQIAIMLHENETAIADAIQRLERDHVILGYTSIINWDKTDRDAITALIEVRVTPQIGRGFDAIAQQIYRYPEVKDCFLMSGGYDLMLIVEGKTLKDVAMFVSERIAPVEAVLSTQTHFILKTYKREGTVFEVRASDDREAVIL
ncbi:MAG: Lrp/AsnC family transcriptional regulator [Clostridiaceae bacterium]|jgi:DNA-binding Lrp family transcriptional regulator|nr:Lrp/AsnC family transcriptional regulator [Clostridiaceae bacterium]